LLPKFIWPDSFHCWLLTQNFRPCHVSGA
jgi:hypothetical protein